MSAKGGKTLQSTEVPGRLAIIIVTYNSAADVGACLDAIRRATNRLELEIWVVDNNSKDGTLELVREIYPEVRVIANDNNPGFPGANNQAIRLTQAPYILLLNPDTVVAPDALSGMVDFMIDNPDCGICGAQLHDISGQDAPDIRFNLWSYLLNLTPFSKGTLRVGGEEQQVISGACLLFRRSVVDSIGLLDESLFWCEDVDFCLRVRRAGFRICKLPSARVLHVGGQSARTNFEGKMYTRNVSLVKLITKHYRASEKWALLAAALLEIGLRTFKWYLIGRFKPSDEAAGRLRGLTRVLREFPTLV